MDFTNGHGLHSLATAYGSVLFLLCFYLLNRRMTGSGYPLERIT